MKPRAFWLPILVGMFACLFTLFLPAQSPTTPLIQGLYNGKTPVPVKVQADGTVVTSGGGGSGCPNPCPTLNSQTSNVSAAWTSGTTVNTTLAVSTVQYANVAVGVSNSGTISGGIITFEASQDNSTWVNIGMMPTNNIGTLQQVYSLSNGNNQFQMYVGGLTNFRVRLSLAITGAGTSTITIATIAAPSEFSQFVSTDAGNRTIVVAQAAVGAAAGNPFPAGTRDDSNNALATHSCPDQAAVTISAGTDVTIISGSASKTVYICHVDFAAGAAANLTIRQGTQMTTPCDTGTVALTGAYQNVITYAEDFGPYGPLHTTSTGQDVCLHFSAATTAGGVVMYAVY